jgi:sporulation protein YlmC with PRC-barrel domain
MVRVLLLFMPSMLMMGDSNMKHQYKYAVLVAAMALAWGTATAQSPARTERADGFSRSLSYEDYLKGADLRASELIGSRVRNAAGDTLGEIEEIVIPSGDQDDTLVIVSVGGVLDVGDKLVALPYDDLRVSPDGDTFYFDRTEEQLKAATAFTYEAQAEAQARSQRQVERERNVAREPAATARPTSDRPRTAAPSAANAAKSKNLELDVFDYRASDLIGAAVLDDRGENVGKVDDIVVSTEDDKLHAVIAIGGFLGYGAKLISMPFDDLQITSDDNTPQVRIAMTGDQLQQLVDSRPEFHYERQVAKASANAPRG